MVIPIQSNGQVLSVLVVTVHWLDKWGVAYFYYGISPDLINGLSSLGINRRDERGVEAFYNLAVTPWLRLTADLQWIIPFNATKEDILAAGLRLQTRF